MERGAPGIRYDWVGNDLRIIIKTPLLIRVLFVIFWCIAVTILGICFFSPDLLGFRPVDFNWKIILPIAAIVTLIGLHLLLRKTVVEVNDSEFRVVHLPWHVPF